MLDRRAFVLGVPAALAMGGAMAGVGATGRQPNPPGQGHADRFEDLVGADVQVIAGDRASGRLRVVSVLRNDADARLEQFSVRLRSVDAGVLQEGTHVLKHPRLGEAGYFMQPGGHSGDYIAVCCLLRS